MELEKSTMKKALGLTRVSTDTQDVARQRADIKKLKTKYDLDVVRILELIGVSGTATLSNAQVQQILREVQQSGIEGLACSSVDRLARPKRGADFGIATTFEEGRKTIWTVRDGELQMWTDEGWERFMNALTRAGSEWREIRRRTLDGKREKRKLGRNVNGRAVLPRGLCYRRITNAAGKTIDGEWSYNEAELAKVEEAYRLLFEDRYALSEIERRVGWPRGRIRTLANAAWKGLRIYPPTGDSTETLEVPLPLKPVLTVQRWDLAQTLLAKRRTWSKEARDQRHLGKDLLFCHCSRKYYTHCDKRPGQHDEYYCPTRLHGGPGCGASRLWREIVDAAIIRIMEEYLTNARFLAAAFRRIEQTPLADSRQERERELAKLAARRKKWITEYDEDRITKREFEEKMDTVEKADPRDRGSDASRFAAAYRRSSRRHRRSGARPCAVPHLVIRSAAGHAQAGSQILPGSGRFDPRSHAIGRIPGRVEPHQFCTTLLGAK